MHELGALRELMRFDALGQPLLAVIALALTALALLRTARRSPPALPWPAWPEARAAGGRHCDALRGFAVLLRSAALVLLGVALAGPVVLQRAPPEPGEGLDLVLVVDASGSMRALDAEVGGEWRTRLELAREVVARFALHRVAEGDRVGLVVFGRTAFTQCPLTRDGRLLAAALERVEAGMAGEATALGDALTLAVRRLSAVQPPSSDRPGPLAGRLVVLLSDGRSNAGGVPTDVAAGIAVARAVRVHTVGIGSEGEVPVELPAGEGARRVRFERHDLDAQTLGRIAEATGGRFFPARGSRDLEAVYAEIDSLERVPRRAPASRRRSARPQPYLALAGALLVLELATLRGAARRLP